MGLSRDIIDKVIKARVVLHSEHPFFGQLSQYMHPVETKAIPTAAVLPDGTFLLNAEFADRCTVRDMVFVIAHETMHLVTATHSRFPDGGHNSIWNIASDCVINYCLCDSEHGAGMPLPREDVMLDENGKPCFKPIYGGEWKKYDGQITEEIYYDLIKNMKKQPQSCPQCGGGGTMPYDDNNEGSGDSDGEGEDGEQKADSGSSEGEEEDGKHKPSSQGKPCPQCGGGNGASTGTKADGSAKGYWWDNCGQQSSHKKMTEEQSARWKQRAASSAAAARQAGKLPGALGDFITDLLQPKMDWRRVLRLAVSSHLRRRWDWKKISRRTAGQVRTPGKSPDLPSAVIYFDTSGSMSDDELRRSISEAAEIVKLGGGRAYLILGDAEVYYHGEVDTEQLKKLPVQRGGTDFRPVFDCIENELPKRPNIFIGFSDLCGPFPDQHPDYPTVWCQPEASAGWGGVAPFGKVIEIDFS